MLLLMLLSPLFRHVVPHHFVIENFLHWNIECLELEEDYHTDHNYDIHDAEDDPKLDIWWINEAGEQIERPEPEPTAVQLELF